MSPAVRETALDRIAVTQPVAPLPAPEQGKALASVYGGEGFVCSMALYWRETGRNGAFPRKAPLAQAIGNERGSPFPKKKTASLLPP